MNNQNYQYPMDADWSKTELVTVITFYQAVEQAYEQGCLVAKFLTAYQAFKVVVPGKADEKRLDCEFKQASGYSIYRAVQAAKKATKKQFRME
ncbi:MAG: UPF0223 family protein [Loigolactobacillus coryniformis]|uniref:UPF0223 family protein n=1 Tax=Loigolactobacillus coryniformis TaxID=1610 RepID=UPI00264954C1|nr:UPF0223 family protein [Loigolactobacillus coryniformis]MDN5954562.1 UPF0223 family protein [Loigolactobacillus coryniformis]